MQFTPHYSSSTGNLYALSCGGSMLLIEAGVAVKQIRVALGYKLSSTQGALISHYHSDHSKGCKGLIKAGIDCYMTKETAKALKLSGHRLHIIEPLRQFKINNWIVLPFPTEHDCPGSVGFLIQRGKEKMLFLTDSFYCRYRFRGLNIIAIECNWSEETLAPDLDPVVKKRLYRSHFNLDRVLGFMAANDLSVVREIHLIHLSAGNSDAELFKKQVMKATGKPVYVAGE
jgi:phosphoribosyl 1,2-cyclic phosphodiesterase